MLGEKYKTNEGYIVEIIEILEYPNCKIKFIDYPEVIISVNRHSLKKGYCKNPYHKTVMSIGCIGLGEYNAGTHRKIWAIWRNMLSRCYYENDSQFFRYGAIGVKVCDEWHNFQNFAKWYIENYFENWVIDKDIFGGKLYSPDTCIFVPHFINTAIAISIHKNSIAPGLSIRPSGKYKARIQKNGKTISLGDFVDKNEAFNIYKLEKEKYVREMAMQHKNILPEKLYQLLINWEIKYVI